jgi:hypothetical protein
MMTFPIFEDVIVTTDVPAHEIRAGDVGTVVEHHVVEGKEDGFSVEFFDMTGRTVAVITLPGSQLRQPTSSDRPSVRALSHAE